MNLFIISGSTLGTAEYAAEEVAKYCTSTNIPHTLIHNPQLEQIKDATHLFVVCSTHGDGDYPELFFPLVEQICDSDAPFNPELKVLLVGIGSRDYDTFCNAIVKFNELMTSIGHQPIAEPLKIDVSDYSQDPDALTLEYFQEHQQDFLK